VCAYIVMRSADLACNETIHVNSSAAVSLYMTSSSTSSAGGGGDDVISRYPPSHCSLYVAAARGQRLSFSVFTLGAAATGASWDQPGPVPGDAGPYSRY